MSIKEKTENVVKNPLVKKVVVIGGTAAAGIAVGWFLRDKFPLNEVVDEVASVAKEAVK